MRRPSARVSATELQSCTLIRVEGEINDTFDPSTIIGRRGVVVFDLDGVTRITSHGVLQWITALQGLEANYYCFINCRPNTMDQFNLVLAFAQRGEVVSFFALFICPGCEHEMERLIDLRHYFDVVETLQLPDVECPRCGTPAEFDEVPELYFKHVRSAPPPRPPPAATAAIGGDQTHRGRRFEMKKEVDESITAFWMSGYLDQRAYFKRVTDGLEGTVVLEIAELEGISDDGMTGLTRFLARLDGPALIARVPAAIIEPLSRLFDDRPDLNVRIASFLVPLRCIDCQSIYGVEVGAAELAQLINRSAGSKVCPGCMHPLEPQWSSATAQAAGALPTVVAPPDVVAYLRARSPRGPIVGGDRMATSVDPQHLLLGKYQILHAIGQGGMGEVFLARQRGPEHFEKLVVLKRIRRDRIGDPQSRDLFLKEARIAARLSHRNIVQIFDLEKMDDEYLISMEYVNGIDLARALQLSRELRLSWPVEMCCRVLAELCSALHAAHSYRDEDGRPSPIIHRDVSPSNILLSTEGSVKLADFGIARAAGDDPSDVGSLRGKAGYAAPEQCAGSTSPTDERTDIYAAGVVLYECLTLRPVSLGPTMPPTAPPPAWRPHSPPQIGVARSGASPLLQDVFERAIQPDPAQRYRSARDLGRDLERIGRLVSETTGDDLAIWVRRLVALRLEADGHHSTPIVTMQTGSSVSTTSQREARRAEHGLRK